MTIRIWLQLADCWRCQSSIGLTESQMRAARRLLDRNQEERPKRERTSEPSPRPRPQRPEIVFPPQSDPTTEFPSLRDQPDDFRDARERELERLTEGSLAARLIRRGFRLTPAWFVSFLLHLIAILVLALIVLAGDGLEDPSITLSAFLDSARKEGGDLRIENPMDTLADDVKLASEIKIGKSEIRDVLQKANDDAKELQVDPRPRAPLPDLQKVKDNITTRRGPAMSFAARDPRVRAEIVKKEGGTTLTEAAVARGLRWLASVQNEDGSWSLANYKKSNNPRNTGDAMGTSLALLPFLGAGQTHEYGPYKETVAKGLAWMLKKQKQNGDLRAGFAGQAGMYAHGQASIVLCETLALTGDEQFRIPAQRAIRFIELAQHGEGGWRYRPGDKGDTSVLGWQVMALQSARSPDLGLKVDPSTLKLADYFLDQVVTQASFKDRRKGKVADGAVYCYQPIQNRRATATMTAEAILCRMYFGWKRDDARVREAVQWLIEDHMPNEDDKNIYYWYYGTQVMHHFGGPSWKKWNDRMRVLLVSSQDRRGRYPGSWDSKEFEWGKQGGRLYTTSLAVCTLEVYYRHLPLFKQLDLDE